MNGCVDYFGREIGWTLHDPLGETGGLSLRTRNAAAGGRMPNEPDKTPGPWRLSSSIEPGSLVADLLGSLQAKWPDRCWSRVCQIAMPGSLDRTDDGRQDTSSSDPVRLALAWSMLGMLERAMGEPSQSISPALLGTPIGSLDGPLIDCRGGERRNAGNPLTLKAPSTSSRRLPPSFLARWRKRPWANSTYVQLANVIFQR